MCDLVGNNHYNQEENNDIIISVVPGWGYGLRGITPCQFLIGRLNKAGK